MSRIITEELKITEENREEPEGPEEGQLTVEQENISGQILNHIDELRDLRFVRLATKLSRYSMKEKKLRIKSLLEKQQKIIGELYKLKYLCSVNTKTEEIAFLICVNKQNNLFGSKIMVFGDK